MIKQTTDYSIFKKKEGNRELDKANLSKVENSIKHRNLLYMRPILVDENMYVVDGQHRLEVAKKLKIPIFYEAHDCEEQDMILLNCHQKEWGMKDFFLYYIKNGKSEYIRLNEWMSTHSFTLSTALHFLDQSNHGLNTKFKSGLYIFPKNILAYDKKAYYLTEIKKYISLKYIGTKDFLNFPTFAVAVGNFLNSENFEFNDFMIRLEKRMHLFRRCTRSVDYTSIFENINNYRRRSDTE